MTQYAKYIDCKCTLEFVKYRTFRELLKLPCQLLDWRTTVSAGADSIAPEKAEWSAENPFAQNSLIANSAAYATV